MNYAINYQLIKVLQNLGVIAAEQLYQMKKLKSDQFIGISSAQSDCGEI